MPMLESETRFGLFLLHRILPYFVTCNVFFSIYKTKYKALDALNIKKIIKNVKKFTKINKMTNKKS